MDWYPILKDYYDAGYYDNEDMKVFVEAEWITAEQYQEITGVEYVPSA